MFSLLFAAQLSAQTQIVNRLPDVRADFSGDDVPNYLAELREVSRTVYTRTTVRDDGTVQSCFAELSSGDARLDAYTCAIILKRAKFAAAKWINGTPAYSVIRFPVNYAVTESPPADEDRRKSILADLELSVNQLPKGAHKVVDVTLEVSADERGRIVSCAELSADKRDRTRRFPELFAPACEQAKNDLTLTAPLDRTGKPTHSVQTASVRLMLDP